MDDYYELLGVDADAPVDDIRAAYRDKKAAVADTGTDAAKADAAALNKAWNVLSDPYQRGRYDEQRADRRATTTTATTTTTTTTTPAPAGEAPATKSPGEGEPHAPRRVATHARR